MKKKRTSLEAVLGREQESLAPENREREKGKRPKVVQQTVYLPPEVHEQLRRLAFEERRRMHDYLLEGLDRVFTERGLKSIGELLNQKPEL